MALAPSLWGPQRIANTITAGAQVTPSIAGLTNGYFALGWLSVEPIMVTDFGPYLRLQAFDQFGNMSGANQVADTADPLFSGDGLQGPDLAAGLSGSFSVAWTHQFGNTNPAFQNTIGAANFTSGLVALGSATVVSAGNNFYSDAQAAVGPTGRTFVDFSNSNVGNGDVQQQSYSDTALTLAGGVVTVSPSAIKADQAPDVAVSGNRALVTYENTFGVGDKDVHAHVYDATTGVALAADFAVSQNFGDETNPVVAGIGGGAFAIAYETGGDIYVRTVSAANAVSAGTLVNATLPGTQVKAAITGLPDGSFFILWQDPNGASRIDICGDGKSVV